MKRSELLFLFLLLLPSQSPALTLQEGLKIVTESGRDIKIAESDEEAARSAVSLARSPRLPSVDLYGRETWLRYQPAAKAPFGSFSTSQDRFLTYGVRANQVLYDFGRTSASVSAAEHGVRAREFETRGTRSRAALEFVTAYLALLESDKLLQVGGKEVQRYEAHKKDAEARYHAGIITKSEVLQADVTLADSRQRFLTAENMVSLRASQINSLLLRPLNEQVQAEEIGIRPSAGLTLEEAWASAEAARPVLQQLDAVIAAKEENVKAAQAEYMPTFYVSGGYENLENRYLVHQDNWSVIAGINLNLLSGGASSSRVGIARSELRSLKLSREKMLDAIRLEVKGAYLELQSSGRKIEVARTAMAQAEENLRLQRLRFQEGVGTATEVLDAVTLLSTAETNSWKALYGFERAEASFLNAAGKDLTRTYAK